MRKIITFLGVYPKQTEYSFEGAVYKGRVFAEALYQCVKFDEMLVFVTNEAFKTAFEPVLAPLNDPRIRPINVPIGEDSAEMWAMFEAVTNEVNFHDTVVFDITHGLRSIPFLVFLAAAFLKSAKQVVIEAIYYGAFELQKDAQGNPRPAPVIDLSAFVNLLDWLNASNEFIRNGNAAALAAQLRRSRPGNHLQQASRETSQPSDPVSDAAHALESVSRSLRMILPDQAMQSSAILQGALLTATAAQWPRPFDVLTQQVLDAYAFLALSSPRARENLVLSLQKERQLIGWYLERNQLIQAVALAREWLVTWVLVQAGFDDPYDHDTRQEVEKALGGANSQRRTQKGSYTNRRFSTGHFLADIPNPTHTLDLYRDLGDIRNTLLHAAKRPLSTSKPAEDLEKEAIKQCNALNDLPLPSSQGIQEVIP